MCTSGTINSMIAIGYQEVTFIKWNNPPTQLKSQEWVVKGSVPNLHARVWSENDPPRRRLNQAGVLIEADVNRTDLQIETRIVIHMMNDI